MRAAEQHLGEINQIEAKPSAGNLLEVGAGTHGIGCLDPWSWVLRLMELCV